jgi:hypothetical protein
VTEDNPQALFAILNEIQEAMLDTKLSSLHIKKNATKY